MVSLKILHATLRGSKLYENITAQPFLSPLKTLKVLVMTIDALEHF